MSRKLTIPIAILWLKLLLCSVASAQPTSLCSNPDGAEEGNFTIEVLNECNLKTIKVNDLSGGENIRYNFVYQGQAANRLSTTISFSDEFTYGTSFVKPTKITVLQYGTKDGKPMYACRSHILRQNNQAQISYTLCDDGQLKLTIPIDEEINIFDYYEYSFDNFISSKRVEANTLPFVALESVDLPVRIFVRGRFNDPSKDCGLDIPGIFIGPNSTKPTDGFDVPFHPNIKSLVLNDQGVDLTFQGSLDGSKFSIFKRDIDGTYTTEPLIKSQEPGTVPITLQDIKKQQCFYVENEAASCKSEVSAELCTFPLTDIEVSSNNHSVLFPSYPLELNGKANDPSQGNSLNITQGIFYPFIDGVQQTTSGFTHTNQFIDQPVFDCSKKHCYRARVTVDGQNEGVKFRNNTSWSNKICYDPRGQEFDLSADVLVTLDTDNNPRVEINLSSTPTFSISQYFLWHQSDNDFSKVDSTFTSPVVFNTFDAGNETSQCYKIQARNQCGQYSKISESICSIHLEFENNANLKWTVDKPFSSDITFYEVLTKGPSGNIDKSFHQASSSETNYKPNLSLFDQEATFQIEAVSAIGSSLSNVVVKELNPRFYLPSAFSPNSDGHNGSLEVYGKKDRVKEIQFELYDRRGFVIFSSQETGFKWTPEPNSLIPGIYFYKLNIVLDNNDIVNQDGNITVLK